MQHTCLSIMVQGTCSNAGKSLLVAALCRIFAEDGYSSVPFKSQNMALNSFVTDNGEEMGRAQALQAVAAGLRPDVRMNPVLLKPHSDLGSQVIVMGKPIGHMRVKEYIAYKNTAFTHVRAAYDSLAQEADIIVIEGAGSPAEINLKAHDIVNMGMAKYANAPVLLCSDIDRGGAFAALVGTMALLDEDEKRLVKGFILNKFRGDASLLDPAIDTVSTLTGKPFLGVVPWLKDLHLPEEDSVSFRLYGEENFCKKNQNHSTLMLDVAILDLPHISNITDIDALRVEPDVALRIVRKAEDLGTPDILLLPGTKNTIADMHYLHTHGFVKAIHEALGHSALFLGICGGLQMLGQEIMDAAGIESSNASTSKGLGLLPLCTEFLEQKTLHLCQGMYDGQWDIHGYEIHHGQTMCIEPLKVSMVNLADGSPLGWEKQLGKTRVLGTYMHGILDADACRRQLLNEVRIAKGLEKISTVQKYSVQPSLSVLAGAVREAIDMSAIYALLNKARAHG